MTEKDTVSERDYGPDRWTLIRDASEGRSEVSPIHPAARPAVTCCWYRYHSRPA